MQANRRISSSSPPLQLPLQAANCSLPRIRSGSGTPTNTGCTAPAGEFVPLIDPLGQEKLVMYPCFEHVTLMDLLDQQGLSWLY